MIQGQIATSEAKINFIHLCPYVKIFNDLILLLYVVFRELGRRKILPYRSKARTENQYSISKAAALNSMTEMTY